MPESGLDAGICGTDDFFSTTRPESLKNRKQTF